MFLDHPKKTYPEDFFIFQYVKHIILNYLPVKYYQRTAILTGVTSPPNTTLRIANFVNIDLSVLTILHKCVVLCIELSSINMLKVP